MVAIIENDFDILAPFGLASQLIKTASPFLFLFVSFLGAKTTPIM
jgi:hypothetical protein